MGCPKCGVGYPDRLADPMFNCDLCGGTGIVGFDRWHKTATDLAWSPAYDINDEHRDALAEALLQALSQDEVTGRELMLGDISDVARRHPLPSPK